MNTENYLTTLKSLKNININSAMASGVVEPDNIKYSNLKKKEEEYLRKQQFKHDWFLASFSIITGAIAGLISSVIFWLITNSLE